MKNEQETKEFLKSICKKYYNSGDYYFATLTKKRDKWVFGYFNDYPLQHGEGEEFTLPVKMVETIMLQVNKIENDKY